MIATIAIRLRIGGPLLGTKQSKLHLGFCAGQMKRGTAENCMFGLMRFAFKGLCSEIQNMGGANANVYKYLQRVRDD